MKYFYNGQLIRKTKKADYTHAIIRLKDNGVMGLRSSLKAAEAFVRDYARLEKQWLDNLERMLQAVREGKSTYSNFSYGVTTTDRIPAGYTEDVILQKIEETSKRWSDIVSGKTYKVVELECVD